jgi:hypothetical protein
MLKISILDTADLFRKKRRRFAAAKLNRRACNRNWESRITSRLTNTVLAIALLGGWALAQNTAQTGAVEAAPYKSERLEELLPVVPGVLPSVEGTPLTQAGSRVNSGTDIPPQSRLQTISLSEKSQFSLYYWNSTSVGNSAQLFTLFCRGCNPSNDTGRDVPLVSVLRDTLGDQSNENDRVTYIWLLTYAHPRLEQRLLSAVPFFYWRIGRGSGSVSAHDTKPLMELTAPERPMMAQIGRDLVQWAAFDPMISPVRASTQAYRSNSVDDERLHLEEAISYLRQAPVSNATSALTQAQLDTVIARLELRKTLLGGLVGEVQATRVGMQSGLEQERIRGRNWELLRQWADQTGLIFEPLSLAGQQGQYAILWFPQEESTEPRDSSARSIWKLLAIRNPWDDERLKNWKGPVYERAFDQNGSVRVIPLAVYSLDYPKLPLILIDFRNKLSGRRREMVQRSVNELMAGVIGVSHFTNWYVYIGFDFYHFVEARHGKALDEASRLDCYADFRVGLSLDHSIDPALKKDMESRIRWLVINPLEATPQRDMQTAIARYELLQSEVGEDGRLMALVNQERRFELASFGESEKGKAAKSMLHVATLGLYKQQAKRDDIDRVDRDRRVAYQLSFLDSLVQPATPPEIAYDGERIKSSVQQLSSLIPTISSPSVRSHATATLEHLKNFSKDAELQADCTTALAAIKQTPPRSAEPSEVAVLSRRPGGPSSSNEERVK